MSSTEGPLKDLNKTKLTARSERLRTEAAPRVARRGASVPLGPELAAELDLARVDHVRASIRAGTYRVDATGLADRILLEALITVVHDRLATAPTAAHASPG